MPPAPLPPSPSSPSPPQLLARAQVFKASYFEGRLDGLATMDAARKKPTYGAYTYKVGNSGTRGPKAGVWLGLV